MLDTNKKTLHSHPSLLPLRMALIAAESGSPSRPPRRIDVNEQRAIQLIARMKTEYSKPLPFTSFVCRTQKSLTLGVSNTKYGNFAFNLQEVIGSHV